MCQLCDVERIGEEIWQRDEMPRKWREKKAVKSENTTGH